MTPPDRLSDVACYEGLGGAIAALRPGAITDARMAAGLAVYRNNVRASFLQVLADAFPVVKRLAGDDFFRYLAHEYFHHAPMRSRLVSRYGDGLPAFLESFSAVKHLGYLPDIARLEIAWLEAYHAPEAESLDSPTILAALAEAPEAARVILHPSLRLIRSAHPVHTIWTHNRREETGPLALDAREECVLIVRPDAQVETQLVSKAAMIALASLKEGAPLGEAFERALSCEAAPRATTLLDEIISRRTIVAIQPC